MNLKRLFLLCSILVTGLALVAGQKASVPVVFHKDYDISFFGIEKMHPFDTQKYGKIARHLQKTCGILPQDFHTPEKVSDTDLLLVHTPAYLQSLKRSQMVAQISEIWPLKFLPNFLLQRNMLNAMRYATAGTVLGAELALKHGWAINLSGGYHHAKSGNGEGFCFFADIPIAIKKLREKQPTLKVLVVDLDAHQGNGLEQILGPDPLTYIFDMYSQNNYPRDTAVMKYIDFNFPLPDYIQDAAYLSILKTELPKAIAQLKPDLIIYNAGSDIFEQDPLGKMAVTEQGIIERDLFLFSQAFANKTPILMVLSGGYSTESAHIVSASVENILKKFNLIPARPKQPVSRKPLKQLFKKLK
jgi:histone deacetylase 11